jgi:hypothetical protein
MSVPTKIKLDRRASKADHTHGLFQRFSSVTHEEYLERLKYKAEKEKEWQAEEAELKQIWETIPKICPGTKGCAIFFKKYTMLYFLFMVRWTPYPIILGNIIITKHD